MTKHELYQEMKRELVARRTPLAAEYRKLEAAAERMAQINDALIVIDSELAEYDAAIEETKPMSNVLAELTDKE